MEAITSFIPSILTSNLKAEEDQSQLGIAGSKIIDTKPFRDCLVSTTLTDVVPCQLNDRQTGKQRDACIIFLQFNFGPQRPDSDQRIISMKVEVDVVEVEGSTSSSELPIGEPPDRATIRSELEIKGRYPFTARSKVDYVETTESRGVDVDPSFNGASVASVDAEVEKQYRIPNTMSMEFFPAGQRGAIWQLYENELTKSGVPAAVNCALLLQTDGIPFEIEIQFTGKCPKFGFFNLKGKAAMRIARDLLCIQVPREDVAVYGLDDFDSDTFKDWVKTRTQNNWAAEIDYEI